MPKCQLIIQHLKNFFLKNEKRLVFGLGLILVAILSFQIGQFSGQKNQTQPIVIEKIVEVAKNDSEDSPAMTGATILKSAKNTTETKILAPNCAYVGSKSSNKVHLPTCRYAKLIKPENLVCFSSLDEALKQGRVADKNCIK